MKFLAAFAVGLGLAGVLPAVSAQAQNTRSFVSPTGSDSNPCTLVAPCRYFQAALAQTNAGGEIAVLGTAGYAGGATLTINKAISIVNPGGFEAGFSVISGPGIVIAAGASDAVSLRGLTIDGGGTGATGIQFDTGKSLTVENCIIQYMTGDGVDFQPNATSSLSISNTLVADNGGTGMVVNAGGAGVVTAAFNRVEVNNNGFNGIRVSGQNSTGTVNATVYDSVAAGNSAGDGFDAYSDTNQALTTLMLFHSVAANNGRGIFASGENVTISVAESMVTGNAFGWQASYGVVQSYGNNVIDGNGSNETAPPSVTLK
jgi:hypothetical protein